MSDRTHTILCLALAAAALMALAFAPGAQAAETADVIILSDDCRMIRKPAEKTMSKTTIVVQHKAAPAVASASATTHAKAKKRRSIVNPQPQDYELLCDEAVPVRPPLFVTAPEPEAPYSPIPESESPLALAPPETFVPRVPDSPPETFETVCACGTVPPTYFGTPPVVLVVPAPVPPAVPEPSTWALLAVGLYLVRRLS